MKTGFTQTWGKTKEENPPYSPYGPIIWDAEVSEQCHMGCPFCYKSNVGNCGRNTSLEDFKTMFSKLPVYNGVPYVTQCALGIGDIDANEELYDIMNFLRDNTVIPNITINGDRLTEYDVKMLVELTGAISVSCYSDKNICYNAVKRLKDAGCKQVNIHQLISENTYENCIEVVKDYHHDDRLKDLNAIVFLGLKQKGRGDKYSPLDNNNFAYLIQLAMASKTPIGFDSCSANKVAEVFKQMGILKKYEGFIEPCESTAFSFYTSVDCKFFPCSFAEDVTTGINMLDVVDFQKEIWHNKLTCIERKRIMDNNRSCPYFNV
jgi:MoaA/NifB/PqqE/SkfB family radical SAM enzyme